MKEIERFQRRLLLMAVLLLALPVTRARSQSANPLAGLDAYISAAMKDWKIPGVAVGIVKGDSIVFAQGFGTRTVGRNEPVDTHTLFALASDSKQFTGILLAMLADEGKIRWDAPLITYLPTLRFGDDYLTSTLTLRDALTHRSGFARADLLWTGHYGYDGSELLRRMRYLKPTWPVRTHYGYSNLMYLAAGTAGAAAAGKPWDQLIHERILTPLGMTETNTSVTLLPSLTNVATPHGESDGVVKPVSYTNIDAAAPAGAINSNVSDMVKWLRFQLDSGRVGGKRLVSKRNFTETHSAQTVTRLDSTYRAFNPFTHVRSYAIGWQVMDYRGREMLSHAGNLSGMAAMVGLMPEERIGVVVLTNLEGNALRESIMYKVFDLFLHAPDRDWSRVSLIEKASFDSIDAKDKRDAEAKRVKGTKPSLDLSRYAGTYADSLYGSAQVTIENGHLVLALAPHLTGDLEHWNYDTFKAVWRDHRDGTNLVSFTLDTFGHVDSLKADVGGQNEEMPQMKRVADAPARTSTNLK